MEKKYLFLIILIQFQIKAEERVDTSFGTNGDGVVSTSIGDSSAVSAIALQADNKIILAGSTIISGVTQVALSRYDTVGLIDQTFGVNGIQTTLIGTKTLGRAVEVEADGKLLVGGFAYIDQSRFALMRFDTNGTLEGSITTAIGSGAQINSIKIQSDNKIVAGGSSITSSGKFTLARYNVDGSLDTANFNPAGAQPGVVITEIGLNSSIINILLQADGKILAGGSCNTGAAIVFTLARYNTDGSLDTDATTGFGVLRGSSRDGFVTTSMGAVATITSIALQTDGKIIAGGYSDKNNLVLARYDAFGQLDNTFGSSGLVTLQIGIDSRMDAITIDSTDPDINNHKIVVAATIDTQIVIGRFNIDGSVDNTFGTITVGSSENAVATSLITHLNDKYIIAGSLNNQFAMARYFASLADIVYISNPENLRTYNRRFIPLNGTSTKQNTQVNIYVDDLNTPFTTAITDNSISGNWDAGLTNRLSDGAHTIAVEFNGDTTSRATAHITVDTKSTFAPEFGAVLRVDNKVATSDADGYRNGKPFLTITGALAKAQPGDTVIIHPGNYDESGSIPSGVKLKGISNVDCVIRRLNVSGATDLVTMSANSSLENLNLQLTSPVDVALRGIVFPGTTSATANCSNINLTVTNSSGGSANTYGIHSNGTGTPSSETVALKDSKIVVTSSGTSNARGIMVDTANNFNARNCIIKVSGSTLAAGAQTNNSSAVLNLSNSSVSGTTADIAQTAGTINLVNTLLENSNAFGFPFTTNMATQLMCWGDPTSPLAIGTNFMRPGTAASTTNEIQVVAPRNLIVKSMTVRVITAPGGTATDTWTLRKNGADTALTVSLTGSQTENFNTTNTVSYAAGDYISVKVVKNALSASADILVTLEIY